MKMIHFIFEASTGDEIIIGDQKYVNLMHIEYGLDILILPIAFLGFVDFTN